MALIKTKTIKGYDYEYWIISDMTCNKKIGNTNITLSLYKDKATRDESIQNDVMQIDVVIPVYTLDVAQMYTLVKDAISELDTTEEVDERPVRIKFFADAQDDV